jgi:hypothetical protein
MGRKKKFGEESDFVSVRVPKSKRREYRSAINDFVERKFELNGESAKPENNKSELEGYRKFEEFVKEVSPLERVENKAFQSIIQMLISRYGSNLIAVYGIGSFFNEQLPPTWMTSDVDLILIVKSLTEIPKAEWERRFFSQKIKGYDVYLGYNTLEMYYNKEKFKEISGANYEWAFIDIKIPENSKLLYGKDIRSQLPAIDEIEFDYDNILARSLYHVEKSLREKVIDITMREFTKGVFKLAFYLCIFFNKHFYFTSIPKIRTQVREIIKVQPSLRELTIYFDESLHFREKGKFKSDFNELRRSFIVQVVSLLRRGILHKKFDKPELRIYFTRNFGGFPYLIRFIQHLNSSGSELL